MKIEMAAKIVVLVAALAWGAQLLGVDLPQLRRVPGLAYVVLASAAWLTVRRDYYLSFLGRTVFPAAVLPSRSVPDKADAEAVVKVEPNAKVVYWAAEPGADAPDPWTAYGAYSNAGVAAADAAGRAVLRVRRPRGYAVRTGRRLEAHVHYRTSGRQGMLGPVQTVYLL